MPAKYIVTDRIDVLGIQSLVVWIEAVDDTHIRLALKASLKEYDFMDDITAEQEREQMGWRRTLVISATPTEDELLKMSAWVQIATKESYGHAKRNRSVIPYIANRAGRWFEKQVGCEALVRLGAGRQLVDHHYILVTSNSKIPGRVFGIDRLQVNLYLNGAFIKHLNSRQLYEFLCGDSIAPIYYNHNAHLFELALSRRDRMQLTGTSMWPENCHGFTAAERIKNKLRIFGKHHDKLIFNIKGITE